MGAVGRFVEVASWTVCDLTTSVIFIGGLLAKGKKLQRKLILALLAWRYRDIFREIGTIPRKLDLYQIR